ncbi:MAG: caspase family protein [Deltaproteobacteria bacterium]|nr:caspase family protein [Deltaproteobacteria bacterium]
MSRKNQIYVRLCVVIAVSILLLCRGTEAAQTWGLCVGISQYQEPNIPDLIWADKDAIEFCSAFLDNTLKLPKENYLILQDNSATRNEIFKSLALLGIKTHAEDRVYIFYSGHGGEASPILPYDGKLDDSQTFLSLETIKKGLSIIDAQEIILFIDASYSGRLTGTIIHAPISQKLNGLSKNIIDNIAQAQQSETTIITSADGIQESVELDYLMNGLFTYHLMDTLLERFREADADGDGKLTLYEVYRDVYNAVTERTARFTITRNSLVQLKSAGLPERVLMRIKLHLQDEEFFGRQKFLDNLKIVIGEEMLAQYHSLIEEHAEKSGQQPQISSIEKAKQIVVLSYPKPTPTPTPVPATPPVPIQMVSPFPPERTWALCIGISEYDPSDLTLQWADKDAIEFSIFVKDHLKLPEEHYRIRKNREATKDNILTDLGWLIAQAREGDRVYIFYSGHGMQDAPIVPYNSDKFLFLEEIKRTLKKIDAQDIIFFTDACYSGRLTQSGIKAALSKSITGISKGVADDITQTQKGTVIITSADGIQQSIELQNQKNGLFTHYLMDTLKNRRREADTDGDGKLTLYEVYQDVHKTVTDQTLRFTITENSLKHLKTAGLSDDILKDLRIHLQDVRFENRQIFLKNLQGAIGAKSFEQYQSLIEKHTGKTGQEPQISGEEKAKQLVLFSEPPSAKTPIQSPKVQNLDNSVVLISEPTPAISTSLLTRLNILDIDNADSGVQLLSPFTIAWNHKEKMVVQVYQDKKLIHNKEHFPGDTIELAQGEKFEIRLKRTGETDYYKSVQIEIIGIVASPRKSGLKKDYLQELLPPTPIPPVLSK